MLYYPKLSPPVFMLDGLIELRGRIVILAEYSLTRCKCLEIVPLDGDGCEISDKGEAGNTT